MDGDRALETLQGLCLGCGLCCNGTVFECVQVDPEEQRPFESVQLIRVADKVAVPLPCQKYLERRCSIYEQRPRRCKKFTCKLYDEVASGSLTSSGARARIEQIRELSGTIEQLLDWAPGSFSTTRFRSWAAAYAGGESAARKAFPQAFLKYGALRLLMERHFISPSAQ